jgi:hypothetical protein
MEDDYPVLAEKAREITAQKKLIDLVRKWRAGSVRRSATMKHNYSQRLAPLYDRIMAHVEYDEWVTYIT